MNEKVLNDYGVLMSDVCLTADPEFDVNGVKLESITYWLAALMYDVNGALFAVKKSDFDEDTKNCGFATKLPVYAVGSGGAVNKTNYKSDIVFDLYNLVDAKLNKERGISYKVSDGLISWFHKYGDLRVLIHIADAQLDYVDSTEIGVKKANEIVHDNFAKFDNSDKAPSVLNTGIGYKFVTLKQLSDLGLLK